MTKDISLKAACADTFHYPPDWDPSKGSLDQFQRRRGYTHHFGKYRTKNLHKGILVIRFEMPFTVQCLRCGSYISQGVRYDADKRKVGTYFSTPIYEFTMRCRALVDPARSADGKIYCNQRFMVRTDPQNCDYALAEGLRRKTETWDAEAEGSLSLPDEETRRQADPMTRLEGSVRTLQQQKGERQRLQELQELQAEREDDYTLNCTLRRANRQRRRLELAEEQAGKPNFALPLPPPSAEDAREAGKVHFRTDHGKVELAVRRAVATAAPLFGADSGMAEVVGKRRRLAQHARMAWLGSAEGDWVAAA